MVADTVAVSGEPTLHEQCNTTFFRDSPFCQGLVKNNISDFLSETLFVDETGGMVVTGRMTLFVSIIVPILFGIIIVIGFIGNALVVVVVSANKQMRSTTNLLIINLAIANLLFIIFCVPFTASDFVLTYWPFGDVWCRIVQYLIVVTMFVSIYTLVFMSVDRFLAVVHPIKSMSVRTEHHALMAIGVLWVVILVSAVPAVYYTHGERHYDFFSEEYFVCIFLNDEYEWAVFQISFFVTSFVLPLALICGLHLCILKRLWRGVAPEGGVSAESLRGKKRVTRMVVIVVVTFAFCWCPIQIILVLKSLNMYEITTFSVMTQIISHVLAYMNSCINPILYAYLSENFRKAFRKVIYCCPPLINVQSRPSGTAAVLSNDSDRRNGIEDTSTLIIQE